MSQFLGEYECKMDTKGRVRIPSDLIKQFGGAEQEGFILKRGFEKCLEIYPKSEWTKITGELNSLNQYDPKNRKFIMYFLRGATEMTLDSTDRILIPKKLQEYAKMAKELTIVGNLNKISIWSTEEYETIINDEPEDFPSFGFQIMGGAN